MCWRCLCDGLAPDDRRDGLRFQRFRKCRHLSGTKAGSSTSTYYSAGVGWAKRLLLRRVNKLHNMAATNASALNFGTSSYSFSFWMNPATLPSSGYYVPLYFQNTGNTSQIFCFLEYSEATNMLFCLTQDTNG